jgi:hypothetical protein
MLQRLFFPAIFSLAACALAQTAASLPTSQLISEPGAAFRIADSELRSPTTIIAYGDTRFTDPANIRSTNPKVRRWLVEKDCEREACRDRHQWRSAAGRRRRQRLRGVPIGNEDLAGPEHSRVSDAQQS